MKTLQQTLTTFLLGGSVLFMAACGKDAVEVEVVPKTPDYSALSGAPDSAIQSIMQAVGEGNGLMLWQAMPASYQSDVTAIVQLAGQKTDPDLYDAFFATVNRLVAVADKQKEFMFNTSLGGERDPEATAKLRQAWPSIASIVQTLGSSSIASSAGLQNFEGSAFFQNTVSVILKDVEALSKLSDDPEVTALSRIKEAAISVVESTDTTATLLMKMPDGSEETEAFVRVENRWVPQEMAEGWAAQMMEARAALEAVNPEELAAQKPMYLGVIGMIDGVLAQIDSAQTQEQFDLALQGAMMPIMGLLMMGGQGGGDAPMPPMPAMPPMAPMPPVR